MTRAINNTKSDTAAAVCAASADTNSNSNSTSAKSPNSSDMTLEQRVVAALSDHTAEASYLQNLVIETQQAISDAEVIADRMQQIALDPEQSPDLARAKEAAEFAAFVVRRLKNILPRLQEAHQRVTATERATRWNAAADRVEAKRDSLASEFVELFPQIVAGMLDLFGQVKTMDAEVDRLNSAAPAAELRRLHRVADDPRVQLVIANTRLVDLSNKQVWPIPTPQILPEQIMAVPPHPGNDWARANEQRDAARHAEAQRVAAYYANQERQREEREAASARAAREAYRNGGGRTP